MAQIAALSGRSVDNHFAEKAVGFCRGWKKGKNEHLHFRAQVMSKGCLTKLFQSLSVLSGHTLFVNEQGRASHA